MLKRYGLAIVSVLGIAALSACGSGSASASDEYPNGELELIVPFAPGGATDMTARAAAECLGDQLGEDVIVRNQEGAAGTIGTQEMLNSTPDGHTLGMISVTSAVAGPALQDGIGYKLDDIQPVAILSEMPSVLAVNPNSKYQTMEELIAAAEANPGSITVAVPGATSAVAIEVQRLREIYGVEFEIVPFEGGGPARNSVLGGNVDVLWDAASEDLVDALNNGDYRALATGHADPVSYLDVPTLTELGYPEIVYSSTPFSLGAPAGTPQEAVTTLEETIQECQTGDSNYIEAVGENYIPQEFVGANELTEQLNKLNELYNDL